MLMLRHLLKNSRMALNAVVMLLSLTLFACGGSDNAPVQNDQDETGEVVIGVTDAEGDFHNYIVGVNSLTLTRRDGTEIETVPLASEVDFADLTDMTEFITVATVPSGVYVKATMVLDYTTENRLVMVEDADGNHVEVDNIVDANGDAVATMEVSVHLEGRNRLTILPGVPAHLTLDFDLQASNMVDFSSDPLTMTVEPFLLADPVLERPKTHRARGLLKDVVLDRSAFQIYIRPFFHNLKNRDEQRRFGTLNVVTNDETVFEVDGETYAGADGLIAMDGLTNLSSVVAVGDLKRAPFRFVAKEVYAGSSVAGGDQDVVHGTVIAREGDVLTVKGRTLIRNTGSVQFNDEVTVTVDEATKVLKQTVINPNVDKDAISVGQRIRVFGQLDDTLPGELSMDATGTAEGRVRMLMTLLAARVNATGEAELDVALHAINGRPIGLFDFSNTGSQPENYIVATGALNIADLGQGQPIHVRGFVTEFGMAPPDFSANSIINVANKPAYLAVIWGDEGNVAPFSAIGTDGLLLQFPIADARRSVVIQGGVATDLNGLDTATNIAADVDGEGTFVVKEGTAITVHTTFSAMVDDLNNRLDGEKAALGVTAKGGFSFLPPTMTSQFIGIAIQGGTAN